MLIAIAMHGIEFIGWISSLVLLLTIGTQIRKQWRERTSRGVSRWLYAGQFTAELGFILYSFLVRNWVFFFTNLALLLENLLGLGLTLHQQRQARVSTRATRVAAKTRFT